VTVYDLLGREVETVAAGEYKAGVHSLAWHAPNLASGVYFCRLQAGEFTATKKMMLLR